MSALTARGSTRRWRRIRAWILERDGYRCRRIVDGHLCGERAATVGHIVRREHRGDDDPANLQAECETCNYGERPVRMPTPARLTAVQAALVRRLDQLGLPTAVGRRTALQWLAYTVPTRMLRAGDLDAACRFRRWRGPLTRV